MKEGEGSISPTAYRKAKDSTASGGLPGVFDTLSNLEKISGKYRKLIHIIADVDMLKYAYELIRSKKGNLTPATDKETLDGISES